MGISSTFVVSSYQLDNHLFKEDPVNDSSRKNIMQLCLLGGLTIGYPITEKFKDHTLIYWILALTTFTLGLITMFLMHNRRLTQEPNSESLKISILTVFLKRVLTFTYYRGQ